MRLTVITSISYDYTLLPHFIEHYKSFGVDRIVTIVKGAKLREEVAAKFAGQVEVIPASQRFETTGIEGPNKEEARISLGLGKHDWYIPADLDEFDEFPLMPAEMIRRMDSRRQFHAMGYFYDRIAIDGSLVADKPSPSLWEQYPLACKVSENLVRGRCRKVVLARGDIVMGGSGHHAVKNNKLRPGYNDIKVHHFKWRNGIFEALKRRIRVYRNTQDVRWSHTAQESERVVDYLEKNGRLVPEDFGAVIDPYRGPVRPRAIVYAEPAPPSVKIAFVTTCRNRRFSLRQTLPENLKQLYAGDVIVLLDYNCGQDTQGWVKEKLGSYLASGQLLFFRESQAMCYFSSHAKNVAHLLGVRAGAEVLVNLDADNILHHDYMRRLHSNNWQEHYCIASSDHNEGATGRVAVRADVFLKYGGYDEELIWGFGYDDTDFVNRLTAADPGQVLRIPMPRDSYRGNEHSRSDGQILSEFESHVIHKKTSEINLRSGQLEANVERRWGEADLVDTGGSLLSCGYPVRTAVVPQAMETNAL